ncbi:MotA/TolQ/ExbB proton channel family protein [Accumulibacter sp.]|uniref:MotA/TolQ/ExbB proton channel family protein n=1 Tax=Accumulibacter sp. TaxID=2053492 RepID=UPI00258FB4F8|nr:MotA/TolQ/ExbB proton channel family protein [Accumulibacter sp.]
MSSQVRSPVAYFELPRKGRQPFWLLSLFALSVVDLHLMGLFLAFGSLMPRTLPEFLPVLSVRVLDTLPVPPRVEEAQPKKIERNKPSPVVRVPHPITVSTLQPVSTPATTATAMSPLVVPSQPAARLVESLDLPALAAFWGASSLPAAIEAIRSEDRTGVFASLAIAAPMPPTCTTTMPIEASGPGSVSESVTRALRSQIVEAQAGIKSGLTFLASVGSTAPFIGLSRATQVVLDKFAAPVGEALIMFVAIPAVLVHSMPARVTTV